MSFSYKSEAQAAAMTDETVILVDENDAPIGTETKLAAHLVASPSLHRAFSVFLFSPSGSLYLQKRAETKITFPGRVANTVCSHPRPISSECDGAAGAAAAAQRRLQEELGIVLPSSEALHAVGRLLYRASEGEWCEYELDHILAGVLTHELYAGSVAAPSYSFELNEDEVSEFRPWTFNEVELEMQTSPETFSPWFRYIYDAFVRNLWRRIVDTLDQGAGAGTGEGAGAGLAALWEEYEQLVGVRDVRGKDFA